MILALWLLLILFLLFGFGGAVFFHSLLWLILIAGAVACIIALAAGHRS